MCSAGWMIIIVIAACFFALGNIMYPRAKEAETKYSMAITAEQTLRPELESNLKIANIMKVDLNKQPPLIPLDHLDTAAWQIISNGNLLIGLDSKKRTDLIKAYVLINKANEYHARILESTVGIASALQKSSETRNKWIAMLSNTCNELIPILETLNKNK